MDEIGMALGPLSTGVSSYGIIGTMFCIMSVRTSAALEDTAEPMWNPTVTFFGRSAGGVVVAEEETLMRGDVGEVISIDKKIATPRSVVSVSRDLF